MAKFDRCLECGNTGVLSATLVKHPETFKQEKILVVPCKKHANNSLLEKNVKAMEKIGLPVEVVVLEAKE